MQIFCFIEYLPSIRDVTNSTEPSQSPDTVDAKSDRGTKAVPVSQIRVGTIVYFTNKFFRIQDLSPFVPSSHDVIVYIQVYKDGAIVHISEESHLYITYYHSTPRDATNDVS